MLNVDRLEQLSAMSESTWKTLRSREVYRNQWSRVIEDTLQGPAGEQGQYTYFDKKDCVIICPLFPNNDIMLVRQWRHAFNCSTWELPCGCIEEGESALAAAQRELAEESKLQAADWQDYGSLLHSDARVRGRIHLFVARKLGDVEAVQDKEELDLLARRVPFALAMEAIDANIIESIMTVNVLLRIQRDLLR